MCSCAQHPRTETMGEVATTDWLIGHVDEAGGDGLWDRWYRCRDCGQIWRTEVRQSGHADIPYLRREEELPPSLGA